MTLSVIFYSYHFVCTILSIPFCPIPFCPYIILSIPFCPCHLVRYHFVLEPHYYCFYILLGPTTKIVMIIRIVMIGLLLLLTTFKPITCGVPQSSNLESLLFFTTYQMHKNVIKACYFCRL